MDTPNPTAREASGPEVRIVCDNAARHPRHPRNQVERFKLCDPMGSGSDSWFPLRSPALRPKNPDGSPNRIVRGWHGASLIPGEDGEPEKQWDSREPSRLHCRRCGDNVPFRDRNLVHVVLQALHDNDRNVATLAEVRAVKNYLER